MFRLLQGLFASMSLERKCLLFFGSALSVLMCGAFFVVQKLGKELVKNTTRQRAQDYGAAELTMIHANSAWANGLNEDSSTTIGNKVQAQRSLFLNEDIEFAVLGLEEPVTFDNLPPPTLPADEGERQRLMDLKGQYQSQLSNQIEQRRPDITEALDLGENEAMSRIGLGVSTPVFAEIGPVDDRYIYYKPVFPTQSCIPCHQPTNQDISLSPDMSSSDEDSMSIAKKYPFRVIRVSMPYQDTQETTTWIRAIIIALAMLIVAVTLFVLHAIVRYLVLKPLYHLRDVSDAITHGDTNQRATLDTEDEFRELADAFNRMLRHMTETQDQIQEVNEELDGRVDQLAQLNLQLYEANRLKSDFLANMSHELRTPLNSIIGFSDVLQGIEALDDKQRRYAQNIQKSGRLLLEMINDILDLAKVEAGKMEVRRSEFDLARLVSAQCDMIGSLSEDKNISVSVDVPANLPSAFQDPNKLGQIINNLLSNAIKFTPEGGMITVRVADLLDGRFRLQVTDTGVGIAEEDQSIIFQKFRQSHKVLDDDGLTREFAGTGLGLSIVKELAKLLGGEIAFESELGRGSTFWVVLPWRLSDRAPIDLIPSATPDARTSSNVALP
ncbi:sensor histidine kinase [Planctomycetes bacterium K23_9]|uniref:histidine kinase n=1 Tax=Stieleria marina TaxID=1930275 RepID=A0A517P2T9_9BACT|nr:Signal transduction histidine-protein kinase BarA [Planctomycetes bacterium K23_9]